ncbi:LysR family transcriptional regulator [Pontibacterium sp.]|uniref:LysR family transcriptional regulator n=1 Tax=Pontibacterium sp. TaxID=2036026 RepID=UPI00356AE071
MEIHQLKTFVAVAREGSITNASDQLCLSQPAVSAHIKAMEETLGIPLFERTPRGMSLTPEGQRLLTKAEQTLNAHRELLEEASRIKGRLTGKLRLGAGGSTRSDALGHLLTVLSERYPEVDVELQHGTSLEILQGIRNGHLDAGFYNEAGTPGPELATLEINQFGIYLAAPPGLVTTSTPLDWQALAELPWIGPTANACCGQAAEALFKQHQIRPKRMISIDRESVTRTLIAGGVGIGLLHAETAQEAEQCGEIEIISEAQQTVQVLFAYLAGRAENPLLSAASSILRETLIE